jgi:dihydrofolate reductase
MNSTRDVIVYIAISVDGYIAGSGDDMSFLSVVEQAGEDYGYNNFIGSVDTVIIGRKTYDWVMTRVSVFPHANKETYVISRSPRPTIGNIKFYSGDLTELLTTLKSRKGKNIFVDGGAEIVNALLKEKLIDEIVLSVIPVMLGEGVKLFKDGRPSLNMKLMNVKYYEKGLVQMRYTIVN